MNEEQQLRDEEAHAYLRERDAPLHTLRWAWTRLYVQAVHIPMIKPLSRLMVKVMGR